MKKLPIIPCISEAIKYAFDNFKNLTIIIAQLYVLTLLTQLFLAWLFDINFNNPVILDSIKLSSIPTGVIIYTYLFGACVIIVGLLLKMTIYLSIVLNEPFEANILKHVIKKNYWYGLWGTLKMYVVIFLSNIASSIVLIVLSVTLAFIFQDTLSQTLDVMSKEPINMTNILPFMQNNFWIVLYIIFVSLSYLTFVLFVLISVIYIPLMAFIGEKASIRKSWKIASSNKLRLLTILAITYLVFFVGRSLIVLPLQYLVTGSLLNSSFWIEQLGIIVAYYLSLPFIAALAISYCKLVDQRN